MGQVTYGAFKNRTAQNVAEFLTWVADRYDKSAWRTLRTKVLEDPGLLFDAEVIAEAEALAH